MNNKKLRNFFGFFMYCTQRTSFLTTFKILNKCRLSIFCWCVFFKNRTLLKRDEFQECATYKF